MVDLKKLIFDVIVAAYVAIALASFVPWLLLSVPGPSPFAVGVSDAIFRFFSVFCHQLPWRSLFFEDIQCPVCARCLSIYVATALGLVFFRLKGYGARDLRMNWVLLALLFVPTGIDGLTQMFGMRESTNFLRLVTGVPYGIGYAYILAWGVPFVYALLELIAAALKKDDTKTDALLARIKYMAWPFDAKGRMVSDPEST